MRERAAWNKTAWKKGRGLTLMGLITVLFILILLLLFGMKLLPAYIEYGTAKKAIDAIARDRTGAQGGRAYVSCLSPAYARGGGAAPSGDEFFQESPAAPTPLR